MAWAWIWRTYGVCVCSGSRRWTNFYFVLADRRGKNVPAIYDKTNLGRFLHRGGASKRSSGMMMAGIRNARRGVGNGGDRSGLSLPQAGGRLQRQDAKKKKMG